MRASPALINDPVKTYPRLSIEERPGAASVSTERASWGSRGSQPEEENFGTEPH